MINVLSCAILLCATFVECQNIDWQKEACLVEHKAYYAKVMQQTFTIIEKDVKWCNMKMINRGRVVDERLFKWHAKGIVNYTDGFVVSVEKINLTNIRGQAMRIIVNGTQESVLTVQGLVNLAELTVGYDVTANLENSGTHRFTGEYSHPLVAFRTLITWNPNRSELSTAAHWDIIENGKHLMNFRPSNNITEMLSRNSFSPSDDDASFSKWAREIIAPRMLEVAKTFEFPAVRFDDRC